MVSVTEADVKAELQKSEDVAALNKVQSGPARCFCVFALCDASLHSFPPPLPPLHSFPPPPSPSSRISFAALKSTSCTHSSLPSNFSRQTAPSTPNPLLFPISPPPPPPPFFQKQLQAGVAALAGTALRIASCPAQDAKQVAHLPTRFLSLNLPPLQPLPPPPSKPSPLTPRLCRLCTACCCTCRSCRKGARAAASCLAVSAGLCRSCRGLKPSRRARRGSGSSSLEMYVP
jgi:hypothetical protein